jgi:hypothetical protein
VSGVGLGRDPVRLGPLLVRALELPEGPRCQARGRERARPPGGGSAVGVGSEEGRGVLLGGEVLAADVPVHEEVAACTQARLARGRVTAPRGGEERVERGLEVPVLGDAALDGPPLAGALDAVADLAGDAGEPAGMPARDRVGLALRVEPLARVFADRLLQPQPVVPAIQLHEGLVDERLQRIEAGLVGVRAHGLGVREGAGSREDSHAVRVFPTPPGPVIVTTR